MKWVFVLIIVLVLVTCVALNGCSGTEMTEEEKVQAMEENPNVSVTRGYMSLTILPRPEE